jgi:hypothetical protein
MFVIVLNQSNLSSDGTNSELIYKFPNSVVFKDKYIAVSSIAMFYSWFNITQVATNNNFSFTWTAGAITTTYQINIPDGLYDIVDINNYIQYVCIQNSLYWTIGGVNYYPFEISVNPNRYAIQINTYLIPTVLPAGASIPAGFPGFPAVARNTVVTIPQRFNVIIGYTAGFVSNANIGNAYVPPSPSKASNFATKNAVGTISYLSDQAPQVQPNSNVLFSISNINNPYSQPSSIIYSLSPKVKVGEQVSDTPPNFMWNKMIDGTYSELRLQLLGTNKERLVINDPNMTILLTIRDKIDIGNL